MDVYGKYILVKPYIRLESDNLHRFVQTLEETIKPIVIFQIQ